MDSGDKNNRISDLSVWDVFILAGSVIAISEIFGKFVHNQVPIIFAFCLLAIAISLKMCWKLRRRSWFIPYFLVTAAVHIPVAFAGRAIAMNGFYLMAVPLIGIDVFLILSIALKVDDTIGEKS